MPTLKIPLIVTADCAIATAGAARTPATASARSFFCIKGMLPSVVRYGGAYAPPPKPLVVLGLDAFSTVGGGRRNENPLCKGLQLRFVAPTQQIEEYRLSYCIH